jgi:cell division transport system permease protein
MFLLLFLHTNSITSILKERINIIVELNDTRPAESLNALGKGIDNYDEVVKGSTTFISSDKASEIMGQDLDVTFSNEESPFKDVLIFNVKAGNYDDETLALLKARIMESEIVSDVIYENLIIDNIKSNLRKLSFGLFILNIFFLILVIVIMYNTINLSLYADRWEIKTMEIIGARDRFIRQPYLKIAGRIALTSFTISTLIILLIIGVAYFNSEFIEQVLRLPFLLLSILAIFVLSLCITIISTIRIVNSYLYKEESELY